MIHPYELKAEDVRAYTLQTMKERFEIKAEGYCCTTDMILDVLIKASAECSSLEAVCADLEQVADSNTMREYLNQALPVKKLREQEEQVNQALADCIPSTMLRKGIEVAIDFHDEPFYGKQESTRAVTCNGQAKKGTTHFVRIATAYVIWRQVRLTLAVHYVLPDETALQVLKILLQRLKSLDFEAKVLYLDKGFAATPIVKYLTDQHQPAIIANPIRGKQGGTRALCRGRSSYLTSYTFTDGTQVTLAMKASLVPDKTGKLRRKWLAFIVILLDWSPEKVYQEYRRRFGVECSYRLLRRVRATTTSRNPALRFFLLGLGLILTNAWVFLRWEFARLLAPGPRRVDEARFRLHRFSKLLIRSIEKLYGTIAAIPTHISPQSVIY
ncbi:MAG TPA: transposase [Candidatus Saccharimonadales bacterium]|nr:transposase [Candidatus Saccharimonadales bacterium]